jgi:uncharacterized DUF497 family protein
MRVEFDEVKSGSNEHKHGVPLSLAASLDWSEMMSRPDTRRDYGELRELGFVPVDGRLYTVVFTQRGDVFRVISLRKSSNREMDHYEQANFGA